MLWCSAGRRGASKRTQRQAPDLTAIKERQQKAWSSGDYGKVGVTLGTMAEMLCEAVESKR